MTEVPAPLTPGAAMTLAAIAATRATPRPSGETLAAQEQRITAGVTQHLADTGLATQGAWRPTRAVTSPTTPWRSTAPSRTSWPRSPPSNANSTYLDILDAPQIPTGPVVATLSTPVGEEGNPITVTGRGFTTDSVVDFGTSPCTQFTVQSDTLISARVPAGFGVVAVRVTNTLGTSPAVASGQFAYGAPVTVTEISPASGARQQQVTITGTGFTNVPTPTVYFGKIPATNVQCTSPTVLTAEAPASGATHSAVRDVRVLVNGYLSPAGPADEFTYTG